MRLTSPPLSETLSRDLSDAGSQLGGQFSATSDADDCCLGCRGIVNSETDEQGGSRVSRIPYRPDA